MPSSKNWIFSLWASRVQIPQPQVVRLTIRPSCSNCTYYGYLNRIQSSRRLEREAQRNIELMWLTGRLTPDFKTIADFRHYNGTGIRNVCKRGIGICRELKLFSQAMVAIDGSKFKEVNSRDANFTSGKTEKRQQQIEQSIQRYLDALEATDRTQLSKMAKSAHDVVGAPKLHAFADRGYFNGPEIKACEDAGIMSFVPRLAEAAFTWHAVTQEVGNSKYQLPEAIDPI